MQQMRMLKIQNRQYITPSPQKKKRQYKKDLDSILP